MQQKTKNKKLKTKNFLEEIIKLKKLDLIQKTPKTQEAGFSKYQSFSDSDNLRFHKLFKKGEERIKLIAEIKFASPTNPHLGSRTELLKRAKQYELSGADAISVITEKHFFKGDISFISQIKKHVSRPVLQKDFVIDQQQIYEAKDVRTDALLLIARLVDGKTLKMFVKLCFAEGIEPVVEINNEEDLEKAVASGTNIIAVNARDLETFAIDVVGACMLIEKIPDRYIKLGFSGIISEKEVLLYKESGVAGVLIGTNLMKTKDIASFINSLQL